MPEERAGLINKHFVLAYILLVGLPLVGVFSILKAGRGLVPLPAVSGEWDLRIDAGASAANNCYGPLTAVPQQTVTISQSGADVIVSFNQPQEIALTGALEGNRLTGTASRGRAAGTCAEGLPIRWAATVAGMAGQRTLEGHFFSDGSPSCAPVAFHAARRSPLRKPGG